MIRTVLVALAILALLAIGAAVAPVRAATCEQVAAFTFPEIASFKAEREAQLEDAEIVEAKLVKFLESRPARVAVVMGEAILPVMRNIARIAREDIQFADNIRAGIVLMCEAARAEPRHDRTRAAIGPAGSGS